MRLNWVWSICLMVIVASSVFAEDRVKHDGNNTWIYIGGGVGGAILLSIAVGAILCWRIPALRLKLPCERLHEQAKDQPDAAIVKPSKRLTGFELVKEGNTRRCAAKFESK